MAQQMMSNFFILEDGKVVKINPKVLLIPEFQRLWSRDRSPKKAKSMKEFAFIYFMADIDSEYNAYGIDKEAQVAEDIFDDPKFQVDQMVIEAVDKYEIMQQTHSIRYLKASRAMIDRLVKHYHDEAMKDEDFDPQKVSASMKNIEEIMEKLEKWEKKVSGESDEMIIRGGGVVGIFEDPENATYMRISS